VRDAFPTATILGPSIVFGPEDQFFNRFAARDRDCCADQRRAVPAGLYGVSLQKWSAASTIDTAGPRHRLGGRNLHLRELVSAPRTDPQEADLIDLRSNALQARLIGPAEPAVDAGSVEMLARQCRVVGRAYPTALGITPTPVRRSCGVSRPLPAWRLVRARTRG
jgi:NADH dehydrogenase